MTIRSTMGFGVALGLALVIAAQPARDAAAGDAFVARSASRSAQAGGGTRQRHSEPPTCLTPDRAEAQRNPENSNDVLGCPAEIMETTSNGHSAHREAPFALDRPATRRARARRPGICCYPTPYIYVNPAG